MPTIIINEREITHIAAFNSEFTPNSDEHSTNCPAKNRGNAKFSKKKTTKCMNRRNRRNQPEWLTGKCTIRPRGIQIRLRARARGSGSEKQHRQWRPNFGDSQYKLRGKKKNPMCERRDLLVRLSTNTRGAHTAAGSGFGVALRVWIRNVRRGDGVWCGGVKEVVRN